MSVSRVTTRAILIAVANTRRDPMRIILCTLFSIRRTLREKRSQGGVTFARTAEQYVYAVFKNAKLSLSCSVVPPRRVARGFEFGLRFFPFLLFFLGFFRRIENRTPYPSLASHPYFSTCACAGERGRGKGRKNTSGKMCKGFVPKRNVILLRCFPKSHDMQRW